MTAYVRIELADCHSRFVTERRMSGVLQRAQCKVIANYRAHWQRCDAHRTCDRHFRPGRYSPPGSGKNWRGARWRRRTIRTRCRKDNLSRQRNRRRLDRDGQCTCGDRDWAGNELDRAELAMSVVQKVGMADGRAIGERGDNDVRAVRAADFVKAGEVRRLVPVCKRRRRYVEQDRKQQGPGQAQMRFPLTKHCAILHAGQLEIPLCGMVAFRRKPAACLGRDSFCPRRFSLQADAGECMHRTNPDDPARISAVLFPAPDDCRVDWKRELVASFYDLPISRRSATGTCPNASLSR